MNDPLAHHMLGRSFKAGLLIGGIGGLLLGIGLAYSKTHILKYIQKKRTSQIKPTESPILNRITSLEKYKKESPYPNLKCRTQIHISFFPLNPSEETVDKFYEITNHINNIRENDRKFTQIRPWLIMVDYDHKGYTRVMQTARYYTTNNIDDAIYETNKDANLYQKFFDEAYEKKELQQQVIVVREKIETPAATHGVPVTDPEAKHYPKYFEFYIRVERKNHSTDTELTTLSTKFSSLFNTRVGISYDQRNEQQRYLNVRFRNIGLLTARERISKLIESIDKTENFRWIKTYAQYIPFDSFPQFDNGWLD
ncbi:MAG: hypothetical protein Hyperionvirus20_32 [Hyperionvirus sp.]|uniref:Uncharacterized protein n=1 Tax=Hyperionvirus sp. TaxID=2487770 RepID=A0A3G5ACD9_9VIRU|nr:MAG: hypothetical protein Hyperionvirus20_32 [Hyperionvirus sp.]